MSYRIPPELSNEIINYLSDDKEALKACSLASRSLTALSQKHFFSCVVIRTPSSTNPESTQPQSLACDLGGSPPKFRALLDTSPHIADYIECLQMINIGPFSDDQLDMYNNSLPHCLPYIDKLKALVIYGLHRWDDSSQEMWSSILPLFQLPSLIHLDLSAAPHQLLEGTLGPNIKYLCVRHDTDFQFSLPSPPILSPVYLDSLMTHCSLAYRNPRCEAFSRIKVGRLRKLVIREVWCDLEGPGTRNLLQLCQDSLEELVIIPQLDEAGDFDEYYSDSFLDLSKLNKLQVLVVHLWRLDIYQVFYIEWLNRLIHASSSPNKTLKTFIIRLVYPKTPGLMKGYWTRNDIFRSIFDDATIFPSLKTLTILITTDEGRHPTKWYNWFNNSKYVRKLRSERNINVEVLVTTDLGNLAPLQFACDARWECVATSRNDIRDLVTDVPGLRRPIHLSVNLD